MSSAGPECGLTLPSSGPAFGGPLKSNVRPLPALSTQIAQAHEAFGTIQGQSRSSSK